MKSYQFAFEKLEVWQMARKLTGAVYQITACFPPEERFVLVSQMRRSAISVCSNIAEGSSRKTGKDQAHFTTQAYSSLMELLNQQIISCDLGYLKAEEQQSFREKSQVLSVKLTNLRDSQLRRNS